MSNDNAATPQDEQLDAEYLAARQMVSDLCNQRRDWVMSIPARPDYDPDLVIARALDDLHAELARVTAERDEARMVADKKHNMIRALIGLKAELRAENDALRARLALFDNDQIGFARHEPAPFSDGPPSEDYPGELRSDGPVKHELRDLP
jgi:hypothetical protein